MVPREPTAVSAGGEREAERRGDVPTPRKRAVSTDAIDEREAKRTRSLRPSEASPALSPPALGVVDQARRLEERARTRASSGLGPAHDPQPGDAPPAASVGVPQASGRGDAWANREPARSTPPSTEVRGRGLRPASDPRLVGPLLVVWAFRALPLVSQYALFFYLIVEFFGVRLICIFSTVARYYWG